MSGKKRSWFGIFLNLLISAVFLAGIGLFLYPTVSNWINTRRMNRSVAAYEKTVEGLPEAERRTLLQQARDYNRRLKDNPSPYSEKSRTEGYQGTLLAGGSGIMGYVMIPKIRVRLPFYHGTEEDVLQTAIGHLEGSSLPVGDPGEHAVLSAHRGLPSAKLFTDLPELVIGDTFVLTVLDREMVYEVDQILTVQPDSQEAIEAILPVEGEDLVSLMTCTPYGVNTHRLLVRGHRSGDVVHATEENGTVNGTVDSGSSFDRYIPYISAAAAVIYLALWLMLVKKRKE